MDYETIKRYLEKEPKARERRNKNRALGNLIIAHYHVPLPKETMEEIVGQILNADRYWRMVTKDNEHLRGSDYKTKDTVEKNFQNALGYERGHGEFIKLTKHL